MPSVHSDRTQATPVTFDPKRRAVIRVLLGAPILTLGAFRQGIARAQGAAAYPSRPLLLVVPYTAGTAADVLARLLGERLAARWSVPVITENRAGAAGIIGTDFVAKAAPNGYTLLFTATAHGSVPALHSNDLPFDPLRSFVPVSLLALSAFAVVVSPKLPVATLNDFLDLVRAQLRRPPGVSDDELLNRPDGTDVAATAEERSGTEHALRLVATLPPDQAEAVLLRVIGGLDVPRTASVMGRSPGAVRVLVHRGLRRLREQLTRSPV